MITFKKLPSNYHLSLTILEIRQDYTGNLVTASDLSVQV